MKNLSLVHCHIIQQPAFIAASLHRICYGPGTLLRSVSAAYGPKHGSSGPFQPLMAHYGTYKHHCIMSYDDLEPMSWHHCHKKLVPGFIFILYDNPEPMSWHLNATKNLCQVSLRNALLYDDLLLLPHCHIAPLHHTIT